MASELAEAYRSDKAGKQKDVTRPQESAAERPFPVGTGQSDEVQLPYDSVSAGIRVMVDKKSVPNAEAIKVDGGVELEEESLSSLRGKQIRSADRSDSSLRRLAYAFVSTAGGAALAAGPLVSEAGTFAVDIVVHRDRQSAIASHASLLTEVSSDTPKPSQGTRVVGDAAAAEEIKFPSELIPNSAEDSLSNIRVDKESDRYDSSFRRFASAAMSTAGSAAHVARPLLSDAGTFAVEVVARRPANGYWSTSQLRTTNSRPQRFSCRGGHYDANEGSLSKPSVP
jgi:hypothetical protein